MNLKGMNWTSQELESVRPPERITVSQWASRNRVMGKASAMPGPYQVGMVPFLVPVMDACTDPTIEEVVLCKSAQIGGSSAFLNVVGFYSDQDPSPIMVILADERTARYVNGKMLQPMFKDSEHLRRLYDPSNFTLDEITLPNSAYLVVAWASSVAALATRSIRIVYCDEVDKPGYESPSKEADALSLARERKEAYPAGYAKFIMSSTPTYSDGNILRALKSCEAVFDWHVPCASCGLFQPLRWSSLADHTHGFPDGVFRGEDGQMHLIGQVVWQGGSSATKEMIHTTARYRCGECAALWTTGEKNDAVRKGRMVSRKETTGHETKIGFHVNRLYSLFDSGRLEKLVERWVSIFKIQGPKHKKALQGFINSALAEPWKQVTITSTETKILQARSAFPPQVIPCEALALTAGIDCQKHGFWFVVRAWARDLTSWLVHYGFLTTWDEVEDLLFRSSYPIDGGGGEKPIWRAALDVGGGKKYEGLTMTEEAYWWVRQNGAGRGCRVWAVKGSSRPLAGKVHIGSVLDKTPSGKPIPGGLQLILVDTDKLKDTVFYRLGQAIDKEVQGAYLHSETGEDYVKQILAEEKQRDQKGIEKWVQIKAENHLLDAECLAHIVADPEWPGGGINLMRLPTAAQKAQTVSGQKLKKFNWLSTPRDNWFGRR